MRWVIRILGFLVAIVVVAVAAVVLMPTERIVRVATDRFEAQTGRALVVSGPVRPSLYPRLGVRTGPVTLAGADWSENGPLLEADRLVVGVNARALLGGDVRVETLEIDRPRIILETRADGAANWDFEAAEAAPVADAAGESAGMPPISLDRAVLRDGSVTYIDGATGTRAELSALTAEASLPALAGRLQIDATGRLNGADLTLAGAIDGLEAFLSQGAVPVSADVTLGGAAITVDGRAGLVPLAAELQIDADLGETDAFLAVLGQAPLDLPAGLGREIAFAGAATFAEDRLSMRDATFVLDQNTITGGVDYAMAERPTMAAELAVGALDLSALAGAPSTEEEPSIEAAAGGWPTDAIDASGLHALDARVVLTAESIDLGTAQLGAARIVTELEKGRAVANIRRLAAYDGSLSGRVVLNARKGLSARANLTAEGVAMQPLLRDLADYDRLAATGDIELAVVGTGASVDAMMKSLEGTGSVKIGKGEFLGLDLLAMIRELDLSAQGEGARTIFDTIDATMVIARGVLQNDDFLLQAPLLRAEGKGSVGIGEQTLDYTLTPVVLGEGEDGGLRVPVTVSGPWADPRLGLDLESLAEGRLAEEAEDAVRAAVEKELGVTLDEDADVESVLEDVLNEGLSSGLDQLLGR